MEGVLPYVPAGTPVIAVPTDAGNGASYEDWAPLTMFSASGFLPVLLGTSRPARGPAAPQEAGEQSEGLLLRVLRAVQERGRSCSRHSWWPVF